MRWQEQRKTMQEDRQGKAELAKYQDEVCAWLHLQLQVSQVSQCHCPESTYARQACVPCEGCSW